MKVVVQSMIEKQKRKNLRITAMQNDVNVSQVLEMFIDKFIEQPQNILKILKYGKLKRNIMNKELLNSYIKIKELAIIKGVTKQAILKVINNYHCLLTLV